MRRLTAAVLAASIAAVAVLAVGGGPAVGAKKKAKYEAVIFSSINPALAATCVAKAGKKYKQESEGPERIGATEVVANKLYKTKAAANSAVNKAPVCPYRANSSKTEKEEAKG